MRDSKALVFEVISATLLRRQGHLSDQEWADALAQVTEDLSGSRELVESTVVDFGVVAATLVRLLAKAQGQDPVQLLQSIAEEAALPDADAD